MPDGILIHPAMWHVALESWQWIHQVAAPYSMTCGSGMPCHWICPNVRHIAILHLVPSSQSTCHSAPVSEILSKSEKNPRQRKNDVMSIYKMADLSHLGFYWSNNGFFEKPNYNLLNCLVFQKIAFLHFGVKIQDCRSPPSWILGVP